MYGSGSCALLRRWCCLCPPIAPLWPWGQGEEMPRWVSVPVSVWRGQTHTVCTRSPPRAVSRLAVNACWGVARLHTQAGRQGAPPRIYTWHLSGRCHCHSGLGVITEELGASSMVDKKPVMFRIHVVVRVSFAIDGKRSSENAQNGKQTRKQSTESISYL